MKTQRSSLVWSMMPVLMVAIAVLCLIGTPVVTADGFELVPVSSLTLSQTNAGEAVGAIQYDSGNISGFVAVAGSYQGNLFNSAVTTMGGGPSPLFASGSISAITGGVCFPARTIGSGTFPVTWSVYQPTGTATAARIATGMISLPPATASSGCTILPLPVAVPYTGSNFIAGFLNRNASTTGFTDIAVAYDATPNPPYLANHGAAGTAGAIAPIIPITSVNAVVRVGGNVLVPVELMGFTIE